MTITTEHRTDSAVRDSVEEELAWNPLIDAAHLGVAADDGVVTLSGEVPTYAQRIAAVKTAQRILGVAAVADEITVALPGQAPSDTEIASRIDIAFSATALVPRDRIRVEVRGGTVILTGEVEWNHQRTAARRAVERVPGVRLIDSRLTLRPRASAGDTAERIRHALVRRATVDANRITVGVEGTTVTLTGSVSTWDERQAAGQAAWSSPAVTDVHNDITIRPR